MKCLLSQYFSADAIDDEMDDIGGVLVDRNCSCCRECCLCLVLWLKLENFLYQVVSDPLFDLVVTLCIVLNTIFLAIEHHGMSDDLAHVLTVGNYVRSISHKGTHSNTHTLTQSCLRTHTHTYICINLYIYSMLPIFHK